jgi:S1-C subfamily serine protease
MTDQSPDRPTDLSPGDPSAPPTEPVVRGRPADPADAGWRMPQPMAYEPPGATATPSAEPVAEPVDTSRYSPPPSQRPDWSRPEFADPVRRTPEPAPWYEQAAPLPPPASRPAPQPASSRGGAGAGVVLAASLVAAVLASGGTFLALEASGALDTAQAASSITPSLPPAEPAGTHQPVVIDEQSAIVDVAAKVGPAVVKITVGSGGSVTDPLSIPDAGVGSGMIYDANGWILTNHHVVQGGDTLTVELQDGRTFPGKVYGIDTLTDLAIVKVDATGLPTVTLGDSDALKIGQLTVAIGSPLGTYSNSVTSGILSARGRSITVEGGQLNNLLQTDTAINPGNSGGPLIDAGGNVIGINTAIATSAEGIGFAIPIDLAKPIMQQAVAGQQLARPYIGVRFETIDYQLAQQAGLSVQDGALIQDDTNGTPGVVPGGPADKAGVKSGDIITAIGGIALDGEHPLDAVISQFSPGQTVSLDILRNGQKVTVEITLGTRPPNL